MSTLSQQAKRQFAQWLCEQMSGLGVVQAKSMFGGFGFYLPAGMFAISIDDQLYLKADDANQAFYVDKGLAPFRYESKGKVHSLRYFQAPAEALDDRDAMTHWAGLAYGATQRQAAAQAVKAAKKAAKPVGQKTEHAVGGRRSDAFAASKWPAGTLQEVDVVADLRNLGPKSQNMLAQAGIHSLADLQKLGAVMAYARTKSVCQQASLNLLWALEGALSGRTWQEVAEQDRASLLMALEDVQRHLA